MLTNRKISNTAAILLLGVMLVLMFFSQINDSATMDELAHLPAGYSYLTLQDHRLNPEHPPLIKDLAAFPLLFLDLEFPTDVKAWTDDLNGQWEMGRVFLYESGNNPDQILFWSHIPMMMLAVVFGWMMFSWIRKMYGDKVSLLALSFFAFSPTFIAHSRYVTTDLAAAFGFFIGIVYFVKFLENPVLKRMLTAGIALGIALLLKFSLALLLPVYALLIIAWVFAKNIDSFRQNTFSTNIKTYSKDLSKFIGYSIIIGLVAAVLIWVVELFHIWNYPIEKQVADAKANLKTFGNRFLADPAIWMSGVPILRPFGQYATGLLMVIQRAAGGNTTYFLGDVSNVGWTLYFPVAYILKEQLALHVLTLITLIAAIKNVWRSHDKTFWNVMEWVRDNFTLAASILFIAVYWQQSMSSILNIGVRHVMPTFPFIYLLVSRGVVKWLGYADIGAPQNIWETLRYAYQVYIKRIPRQLFAGLMIAWMFGAMIAAFPRYVSYYNEIVWNNNGYEYIVDSNYDWGQDLKRFRNFVEKEKIEKIAMQYFGAGSPKYYLDEKYVPWWSERGAPNPDAGDPEWFAISATIRQGATARQTKGFTIPEDQTYSWLKNEKPVARAGDSIFIYRF